jgi:hypothetical protein
MARRKEPNRDEQEMTSLRVDGQPAARREAMPAKNQVKLTGIVGDKSAEAGESRSGEDARRRGWYWNWNTMVTQFAPLIGLDGKGLLDSYIVWTDRREDSPFRGYAFPSTTAEANFYGIDRNVLGTINKILVALDLIEIKKSMVHRPDDAGNDWKFPHNTYRVKDQTDTFQLTADAVRRVVQLATEDTAVYRRIKHIFGSKFKPIDPNSVWYSIIEELEPTPNWRKLQALALEDERRTSERSRKGHAARRTPKDAETSGKSGGSRLEAVTEEQKLSTVATVPNDSDTDTTVAATTAAKSIAAETSKGSRTSAAQGSNALAGNEPSDAAPISNGEATVAQSTSTTNYQDQTTTTTGKGEPKNGNVEAQQSATLAGFAAAPDDSRDRELTLRLYDEANDKPVTIAARRMLGKIADEYTGLARSVSLTGWALTGCAIEEAVSSGSTYVAPKRVREILARWSKDGVPANYAGVSAAADPVAQPVDTPVTSDAKPSHSPVTAANEPVTTFPRPVTGFQPVMPGGGRDTGEVWQRALAMLQGDAAISPALYAQFITDARLREIEGANAVLQVSHRLMAVCTSDVQRAVQGKLSVAARTPLYLRLVSADPPPDNVTTKFTRAVPITSPGGVFDVPGSGMNSAQLWAAVQQSLSGSGDIPRAELQMWSASSELLALADTTFVLGFASGFLCRRAEHRREDLQREFSYLGGFSCEVEIVEIDAWKAQQERGA